jgi:outer membrane biosynthesis protein TonB
MFMRAFARELPPRMRLLKYTREGNCRIEMRKELSGMLQRGGRQMKLDSIPELTKDRRRGTVCMDIKDGEAIDIVDGWHTYHVRFVPPPANLKDPRPLVKRVAPEKVTTRSFIGSIVGHLTFALLMTIFSSGETVALPTEKKEEFVEVALEAKQELEEPPPPPEEKVPEPQAAVEKVPESMAAKALPKNVKPKMGGTSKAPPGVLGLLSKRGSSAAPGPAAAVAAVSNLLAAKGPGGASGGYKVSGLIGKLPSNQLSVGGGGGGLLTKGGAALLRGGGGGGGLLAGGQGKRTVGGLVQKDPKAMRSAGQGQLDRDEIQKVINDNIGAIQRCYERELLKSPGLSGKIQVEWTIATSGSVRSVRQTFTSMNSTNTSNCIMSSIRGWRFPKPKGGEVIVNYPFIFKSIGF